MVVNDNDDYSDNYEDYKNMYIYACACKMYSLFFIKISYEY